MMLSFTIYMCMVAYPRLGDCRQAHHSCFAMWRLRTGMLLGQNHNKISRMLWPSEMWIKLGWSWATVLNRCCLHKASPVGHQGTARTKWRAPHQPKLLRCRLQERKLRRFARRVVEYQKAPSPQLQTKLLRDAPLLHSSLIAFSLSDAGLAPAALLLADEVAKKASQRRLAAWKEDIQENVAKLGKWVQQKPPDPPTATQVDGPILPEDKARQEAAAWHTHWNPDHLPHLDQVQNLCLQLNNQVDPVTPESIQVVGADLARSALKAKQKAAGMDAWTAAHLCKLPESFWNHVAVLWSACMQCAKVPTMWKDIRIALIPKAAGGLRPLAITTVLWRICMSATLQKLRPWIQEWALPQLCGGRPGRGIMDVHELLYEDIRAAKRSRVDFVGCKADIRRCFDSVCPKTALAIWRWLGAPASLCDMVENFYTEQRRWFAWQGIFHSEPICARRGLLQGCPASPALLNAVMVVWVRFVLLQEPRVSLAVNLDDRTMWKKGVNGIHVVTNAMQAGAQVDAILGMELHPDKLNSFTTKQHLTPQLSQIQDVLGAPCSKFTLLGIQYNLERAGACVNAEKLSFDIHERCRKIRLAAKRLGTRKTLLWQLVISLFAWTGAFHHYDVDTIKSWTSSIEAAVWGRKPAPGRSRLLCWNSLGTPRLHPAFALHFAAARAEWQAPVPLGHRCACCCFARPKVEYCLQRLELACWGWFVDHSRGDFETRVDVFLKLIQSCCCSMAGFYVDEGHQNGGSFTWR